jgi:hypothetical protein
METKPLGASGDRIGSVAGDNRPGEANLTRCFSQQ